MTAKGSFPTHLVHILKTHHGPVNAVTFSGGSGTYILTGSTDRAVHLSRAIPNSNNDSTIETTSPIQKYEAHGYSVLDIAVATDNSKFASVGGDRQVFLWDVEQGITLRRWGGHNARVEAVQFAGEDDAVVVSGSADTTVNIWDGRSNSHKPIQTLTEAGDTVSSLHVHMPTYSIASGSYDGRARVYDIRMGRTTVDVLGNPITSVRCSADGNALLTSTLDSRIRMLDRDDGKLLKAFGSENTTEHSPLSRARAAAYRNMELRIRSVFAKADAVVLSGSESDRDGRSAQAHIFAWDVLSGNVIASIPAGERVKAVSCVAWNERGKCWAGGCSDEHSDIYLRGKFTGYPLNWKSSAMPMPWP
ncbi:WD40-repeat-containing domain protein [Aspergillus recurvatus]